MGCHERVKTYLHPTETTVQEIVIIQCAGKKNQRSWLWRGQNVVFVANKMKYQIGQPDSGLVAYEPDDVVPGSTDLTWRRLLLEYYQTKRKPPVLQDADELLEAWQLYTHPIYQNLIENGKYGKENVFILSAGWGLVNADYRLPPYDITFSRASRTPHHARTTVEALWRQLGSLHYNPLLEVDNKHTAVIFFGGKKYRDLLRHYIGPMVKARVVVFYKSRHEPEARKDRRNHELLPVDDQLGRLRISVVNEAWPYKCAQLFLSGSLRA